VGEAVTGDSRVDIGRLQPYVSVSGAMEVRCKDARVYARCHEDQDDI
jgi:hypothetical protein